MDVTNKPEALAWAWVLQNAALIAKIARTHTNGSGLSQDDHHSDLLVRLVEKFPTYDPGRSSASTWVWFQSMAVRKSHTTRRGRSLTREVLLEDHHHPSQDGTQEAAVLVAQIRSQATRAEWSAAVAMANGHSGTSLGEVCGCAPFSAHRRVARLRSRIA